MKALPAGIQPGDRVSAPAYPARTFRKRHVVVSGVVRSATPHALVVSTPQGFATVRYAEAVRA